MWGTTNLTIWAERLLTGALRVMNRVSAIFRANLKRLAHYPHIDYAVLTAGVI